MISKDVIPQVLNDGIKSAFYHEWDKTHFNEEVNGYLSGSHVKQLKVFQFRVSQSEDVRPKEEIWFNNISKKQHVLLSTLRRYIINVWESIRIFQICQRVNVEA